MAIILSGCKKVDNASVTDGEKSPDVSSIQNENRTLHDQLTQLQAQLQAAEQNYNDLQKENESIKSAQQPVTTRFPMLAEFSSPQDYKKIEIKYANGSKTIADPDILKAMS